MSTLTSEENGGTQPEIQHGPFYAVLNPDGSLRGANNGDPYVFATMGPHDNHTKHGRKVVRVMIVELPS